jgi:hypothetical protein
VADSTSPGSDAFSAALSGVGNAHPREVDPTFVMEHSKVRNLGDKMPNYGSRLSTMSDNTRAIEIGSFAFGTLGGGLNVAHRAARDSAADALRAGKNVLDSWKTALLAVADNVKTAEAASKAPPGGPDPTKFPKGPGMGPMGGAGDLGGLGDTGLDPKDLGGLDPKDLDGLDPNDLDGLDPNDPNDLDGLDPNDLDGLDPNDPNDLDGLDPRDLDGLDPNDLGGANQPDLSGVNQPNLDGVKQPDLSGLNQPTGTDLAGVDPRVPSMPQMPDTSAVDPRASMSRPGVGFADGGGGSMGGSGTGTQGNIARALNSGMPLYPPPMGGGGAGAGGDQQDRERGPHLAEDEGVWGDDEDIAPAVLGMEE